jgi:predicted hotdog family 3-hydroxylacyl-ACP dehydratase
VRDVRWHVLRLDDIQTDLICEAALVAGDPASALYEFELRSEAQCLVTGRATAVYDATTCLSIPRGLGHE